MVHESNHAIPLLIGARPAQSESDQDQSDLHDICRKIIEAKEEPSAAETDVASAIDIAEPSESEAPTYFASALLHLKTGTGYALLGGRTLSCLYRFVLVNESVRLLFKTPGLNQWQEAPGVMIAADVTGAVLALSDMIQTITSSKKSVLELCQHPNWLSGITAFFRNIFQGKYPKDLLLSGLVVFFASSMKAVVGSQTVLHRTAQFPHMENAIEIAPLTYLIGASSAACFLAFQWFGQGMWVDRAFTSLKQGDSYSRYLSRHKGWDRATTLIGVLMGIAGALVGAVSACYVNRQFEFKNPLHISLFFIALTGAYFNLCYSYNLITRMEWLLKLHNTESCATCLNERSAAPVVSAIQPAETETQCYDGFAKRCSSFFGSGVSSLAALGGSITFSPAIIRTLQIILRLIGMASSNEEHYNTIAEDPRFILGGLILSLPFVYFSMLQYLAVWGKSAASPEASTPRIQPAVNADIPSSRASSLSLR